MVTLPPKTKNTEIRPVERFSIDIKSEGWAKIFMAYSSINPDLSPLAKSTLFAELTKGEAPVASRLLMTSCSQCCMAAAIT